LVLEDHADALVLFDTLKDGLQKLGLGEAFERIMRMKP